jgi:separase
MAAMAAQTFATIQDCRSDIYHYIEGLLQALRLWNRALDALARLHQPPPDARASKPEDNPFLAPPVVTPSVPSVEPPTQPSKNYNHRKYLHSVEWRISVGLASTLLALSKAYIRRGSPRESEFFAQQALDFAYSLRLPAMIGSAWCHKAHVQLYQGLQSLCGASIDKAAQYLREVEGLEVAELNRLRGELGRRAAKEGAEQLYDFAAHILRGLEESFTILERARQSLLPANAALGDEHLGSTLLANVLFQIVWLLRHNASERFAEVLEQFMSLHQNPQIKVSLSVTKLSDRCFMTILPGITKLLDG